MNGPRGRSGLGGFAFLPLFWCGPIRFLIARRSDLYPIKLTRCSSTSHAPGLDSCTNAAGSIGGMPSGRVRRFLHSTGNYDSITNSVECAGAFRACRKGVGVPFWRSAESHCARRLTGARLLRDEAFTSVIVL